MGAGADRERDVLRFWSEATRSRGSPLWARPRTSPSLRSSKSFSASSNPSWISVTALRRGLGGLVGRVRDEDAEGLGDAAADPAAELVELGEPEPVGALDDHHRRLGHVHADLDHGRPDEDVELAVAEAGHLGVAFGRLHPAMDHARPGAGRASARSRTASASAATTSRRRRRRPARPRRWGTTTNVRWPSAASARTRSHVALEVVRVAAARPDRRPGRPAGSAGRRRRGRRRGPGRGSAGSGSRS